MKSSSHAPPFSGTQDGRGFTLIEVVVTMAIIAILAAVAYPSYHSYVAQGNRAEGRAAVMQMLLDQERYYTQMNTYVVVHTGAGPQPLQNFSGSSRATSRYLVTASRCEALPLNQCIRITAEPQFGGGDAKVGTLFATSVGERGCTGTHPSLCWPS
jgi:type IV pilus assembly protein PilE